MSVSLTELPDTARIWVYAADRPLSEAEQSSLTTALREFVDTWTAHGADLQAGAELVENRFAVVAVDEASAPASGCSIDAMVRRLASLERQLGCSLLDGTRVFYRGDSGEIEGCDRPTFAVRAREGSITEATRVFDPTIETLGELRAGNLELSLADSWHVRLVTAAGSAS